MTKCGIQYVGKTRRQLQCRITEHKHPICQADPKSAVASHFEDGNHSISDLASCGTDDEMMIPNHYIENLDQIVLKCECRSVLKHYTLVA